MNACPFCSIPPTEILDENEHAFAVRDNFPASEGHTLIIAKRHVEDYFQLSKGEKDKAFDWLEESYKVRETRLTFLKGDPLLKNLKNDPRYVTFMKKMNLPIG